MTRAEAAIWRDRNYTTIKDVVESDGHARSKTIVKRGRTLRQNTIKAWVAPESIMITNEHPAYAALERDFIAHTVINRRMAFGIGSTNTNAVERLSGII